MCAVDALLREHAAQSPLQQYQPSACNPMFRPVHGAPPTHPGTTSPPRSISLLPTPASPSWRHPARRSGSQAAWCTVSLPWNPRLTMTMLQLRAALRSDLSTRTVRQGRERVRRGVRRGCLPVSGGRGMLMLLQGCSPFHRMRHNQPTVGLAHLPPRPPPAAGCGPPSSSVLTTSDAVLHRTPLRALLALSRSPFASSLNGLAWQKWAANPTPRHND